MPHDRPYMPVDEFRRLGYLQELNRKFLHPLGLALVVTIDQETGQEIFEGIWDYRNDPEGIFLDCCDLDKIQYIEKQEQTRFADRVKRLGFFIQPE